ncbi:MAG: methyltransferase domain-containing protein [Deltaproteobacteria bacterium]|nr:methyltransferase domain-containing protein [Deltaproteobacteria bacterium]
MSLATYYKDHWLAIEPERFARYDEMFKLDDKRADRLLAPLALAPGQTALDLGCGPGYVAAHLARIVGPGGHVHALDVNADFVARARAVAAEAGVEKRVEVHHLTSERFPLADATCDRALAKNVLEYVPDAGATLRELHRVLKPGGTLTAMDSDWAFVLIEPLTPDETRELFTAAAPAFREPLIGRKLRAAFRRAGFRDVQVDIAASADDKGFMRPIVENMLGYAKKFGTMSEARAAELGAKVESAIASGEYLGVLPQFVVRGVRP